MAAVELTRMDFHVTRFMNSDDVEEMSDKEVGQFCLLLFKAWLIAKDVTLPAEPEKLARYARCDELSPLVLQQFPEVETEWGMRRRNTSQLEVWKDAKARSEAGKKGAEKRWGKQWEDENDAPASAAAMPSHKNGNASAHPILIPISDQIISEQNRTKQNTPESCHAEVSSCSQAKTADWKNIAIPYRNVFGKKAGADFKKHYFDACLKFGEDVVLECFHAWATQNTADWCETNGFDRPLNLFFKKLPEEAEDTIGLNQAEKEITEKAAEVKRTGDEIQAASIEKQTADIVALLDSKDVKRESEGSLEDFMASVEENG